MSFRVPLLLVSTLVLSGCFGEPKTSSAPPPPAAIAPVRVPPKIRPNPPSSRDPELLRLVKIATQADQIQREAWWVVSNERKSALRSPFGKLQRAALSGLDERLASKGIFQCDKYVFQKGALGALWSGQFSENCDPRNGLRDIATWTLTGAQRGRVEFNPANLGEVLGMGASIFGRRMSCEISWDEKDIIEHMSCPNWEQDRETHLIRLETYEYHRNKGQILKLKGKVLENLTAIRKIETEVPLEGKITVVETELNAPSPQSVKPVSPAKDQKAGAASPTATHRGPPAGAPLDPDLPKLPGEQTKGLPMRRKGLPVVPPPGGVRVLTPEEQEAAAQRQMEQQMPIQVAPGMVLMPGEMMPQGPIPTANGFLVPVEVPNPPTQDQVPVEESQGISVAPPKGPPPPAIDPNPPAAPVAPLAEPNYIPADQPGR